MRLSAGAISRVWPIMQVPDAADDLREALGRDVGEKPGDRLELVERPAGVS